MTDRDVHDDFSAGALDLRVWVPHYLPQWTTPERSLARYALGPDGLRLLVEEDQPAWREEDGGLRVSNLQTGTFSGPRGSPVGTHRHRADLTVVTPQPVRRLLLPTGGRAEVVMRASDDPAVMLAFWLVGFEETPEDCGELCVAELFGDRIGAAGSRVNVGVKAHHDPRLVDDMRAVDLDLDAREWHEYAVEWDAGRPGITFLVDGAVVHTSQQRLGYPLQLMVDLFEFRDGAPDGGYPKTGDVRSVTVSRR
jgi:hypothetical protein